MYNCQRISDFKNRYLKRKYYIYKAYANAEGRRVCKLIKINLLGVVCEKGRKYLVVSESVLSYGKEDMHASRADWLENLCLLISFKY